MLQQVDLCGQEKKRHHTQLNHSVDSIHSAYIIFEFKRMWTMKIDGEKIPTERYGLWMARLWKLIEVWQYTMAHNIESF